MKKCTALLIMLMQVVWVQPLYAYNRATHQHITELAYGTMKLMEMCQLTELSQARIESCDMTCETRGFEKEIAKGETETSARAKCKQSCRTNEYAPMVGEDEAGSGGGFDKPRFCQVFEPIFATYKNPDGSSKIKTDTDPLRNSAFFQEMRVKACPEQNKYSYDLEGGCAKYDQSLMSGGFMDQTLKLGEYTRAQYGGKLVLSPDDPSPPANHPDYRHLPIRGVNLTISNALVDPNDPTKTTTDLTGTILGYHTGATDLFHDVFTSIKIVPLVEDILKTISQGGAVVVGGAAALIWAVGMVVVCSVSCVINAIFGEAGCSTCFDDGFNAITDYTSDIEDAIRDVESKNLFGVAEGTTTFGRHNTSFHHFMNTPLDYQSMLSVAGSAAAGATPNPFDIIGLFFDHDDVDGYRPAEAFGVGGALIAATFETTMIDQLVDVRVSYDPSRGALLNYQVTAPDDGMDASSTFFDDPMRRVFYWHRQGMTDYVFPPVDNLAYYWWHKWWEARAQGLTATEELGPLPLGAVMHAVQDITQPLHSRGMSLQGHAAYESDVESRMDETLSLLIRNGNQDPNLKLYLNLEDEAQEQAFVTGVVTELVNMNEKYVKPTGVLQIRKLMHDLYQTSIELDTPLAWTNPTEDGWFELVALLIKSTISEYYTTNIGLVRATAATMLILLEASRRDTSTYSSKLDLQNFENFTTNNDKFFGGQDGMYNPPQGQPLQLSGPPATSTPVSDTSQVPSDWACAANLPGSQQAFQDYLSGVVNGRQILEVAFAAQIQCSIMNSGLPMPPPSDLSRLGRYKARQLEAQLNLLSHGSTQLYAKELACAQVSEWESDAKAMKGESKVVVPKARFDRVNAQCLGTLDTDADGVPDLLDECVTPPDLLAGGANPVKSNGCLFDHQYKVGQRPSEPFIKGSFFVRPTTGATP